MSLETWTATCGTKARRTSDLQSSSLVLLGGVEELLANSEFSEETELWTSAVEDERRYIEVDLVAATEGSVGRRGREGNAELMSRSGCGAVLQAGRAGGVLELCSYIGGSSDLRCITGQVIY